MTVVRYYEQSGGDWVEPGNQTAIVYDRTDDRYEVWHGGHCVFGSADSLSEAEEVMANTLMKETR
jgi:hypothetical protein